MDIGCFLGHDLRRLAFDGAPSTNLYGVDIVNHWDLGYDLFRDRDHFAAHFIKADILSDDPELVILQGQIDIISIMHMLHQWGWDDQIAAAKKICSFTRTGSIVVGSQIGNQKAQEVALQQILVPQWRHNPVSFQRFWDQVGVETGTRWRSQALLHSFEEKGWESKDKEWMEDGACVMDFVVTRIE